MNKRQLRALGVPEVCLEDAVHAVTRGVAAGTFAEAKPHDVLAAVLAEPEKYLGDLAVGPFARALLERVDDVPDEPRTPAPSASWGDADIDAGAFGQLADACALPIAVRAALMPDAHIGYGLPIGGVLATEDAVIPYAVGVDIACRMRLSIVDLPVSALTAPKEPLVRPLSHGTVFGVGANHRTKQEHNVMDRDWTVAPIVKKMRDTAWKQLGSSGSGNHFVEWGVLTLGQADLGLAPGEYLALLSHSGSRGTGAAVCREYSTAAERMLPKKHQRFGKLAWLPLSTEPGQEYWAAMELMGHYAAANHEVIHRNVLRNAGAQALAVIENHHNYAWKEVHDGKEVIVHRKGATPAGAGVLGVIPGSMADPAFVVRGKGNVASLDSAAHGAGRRMSRTKAKEEFTWKNWKPELERRGVRLLAAGLDEVPGAYKDIRQVMAAQADLVEVVARFDPKLVQMCGDGSRAED